MEYTRLGSSGLKISRIAMGTVSFGEGNSGREGWPIPYEEAVPFFRQALDLGITFWDTANGHNAGTSEEAVGRALKELTRRDDIVVATKVYFPVHDGPGGSGLSGKAIMEQIDASLTRLSTDYVDLYQIHRFDPDTPVEETMKALHDVVKAGRPATSAHLACRRGGLRSCSTSRAERLDEVRVHARSVQPDQSR
jgi:aryl-alcohol dehydrogenase-like predicted oxidoreductase